MCVAYLDLRMIDKNLSSAIVQYKKKIAPVLQGAYLHLQNVHTWYKYTREIPFLLLYIIRFFFFFATSPKTFFCYNKYYRS